MTLPASTARSGPYAGNGSLVLFDYDFKILAAADLAVILTDTTGVEHVLPNSSYSVHGVGTDNGGQVEMAIPPATDERITILRGAAFEQNTNYVNQSAFRPETIETSLDRLVMADQQMAEQLSRAVVVPPSSNETPDALMDRLLNSAAGAPGVGATQEALVPSSTSILLEQFGAVGDGLADDSAAWNAAVASAHSTGRHIILANKTYLIPAATVRSLTSHVTVIGVGSPVLDGGESAPTLFKPVSAGLTFRSVTTKKLCLMESFNEMTGNVDLIDLRNWRYENTTQFTVRLRLLHNSHPFHINRLVLRDIDGTGGLGGLCFSVGLLEVDIDGYKVKDISVPNDNAFFEGDDMVNTGYADGIVLGEDDPDIQALCDSWSIGRLSITNIFDHRVPKGEGQVASCDGCRLLGRNMSVGHIDVRGVGSQYAKDTTAVYFKGWNSVIGSIYAENSGAYEACVVIKGARRTSGSRAKGFNISIGTIKLFADDGARRSAIYLGPDDIHIGFLSIEGLGGDVEDPNEPGKRLSGSGALVYCENTESNRLHIGRYSIMNCDLGAQLPLPDPETGQGRGAVKIFTLQGFKEIDIGPGFIDNVTNNKLLSNQTPADDPPAYAIIQVFHWGEKNYPTKTIRIGPCVAQNFTANGADVRLYTISGKVDLGEFIALAPTIDATVVDGLVTSHQVDPVEDPGVPIPKIGLVQVIGGDLSPCSDKPATLALEPDIKRFIGCIGLLEDETITARLSVAQSVPDGAAAVIEYVTGESLADYDDAEFAFLPPLLGDYEFDATLMIRPDTTADIECQIELVKHTPAPIPEDPPIEAVLQRVTTGLRASATPGNMTETMRARRVFRLKAGDKVFARFSHKHTAPINISDTGGGVESFIQIRRVNP